MHDKDNQDILYQKANYFCKSQAPVHITLNNGYWKRGMVVEVRSDFFILDELKEGKIMVFYLEIEKIDRMVLNAQKEVKDGRDNS